MNINIGNLANFCYATLLSIILLQTSYPVSQKDLLETIKSEPDFRFLHGLILAKRELLENNTEAKKLFLQRFFAELLKNPLLCLHTKTVMIAELYPNCDGTCPTKGISETLSCVKKIYRDTIDHDLTTEFPDDLEQIKSLHNDFKKLATQSCEQYYLSEKTVTNQEKNKCAHWLIKADFAEFKIEELNLRAQFERHKNKAGQDKTQT